MDLRGPTNLVYEAVYSGGAHELSFRRRYRALELSESRPKVRQCLQRAMLTTRSVEYVNRWTRWGPKWRSILTLTYRLLAPAAYSSTALATLLLGRTYILACRSSCVRPTASACTRPFSRSIEFDRTLLVCGVATPVSSVGKLIVTTRLTVRGFEPRGRPDSKGQITSYMSTIRKQWIMLL